jgi:nicotinate-nucleotide adenylyltransferase
VKNLRGNPQLGGDGIRTSERNGRPLRIGILGGTFNPIHFGHLRTAEETGLELHLEKVYLIPSASPPHKNRDPITPFPHRLAMARLGLGNSNLLEILDLEGRRPGLSYSIETLREFHRTHGPDLELFFILGTDAFLEIETWKEYKKLFDYAHFVIIQRPGYSWKKMDPLLLNLGLEIQKTAGTREVTARSGKRIILFAPTLMDISSTRIREMAASGKSIHFLVPKSVENYISEKGLYRNHENPR